MLKFVFKRAVNFLSRFNFYRYDYKLELKPSKSLFNKDGFHPLLYRTVNSNNKEYFDLLNDVLSMRKQISQLPNKCALNNLDFSWDNGFLPGLDVALLYTIVSKKKPSTIIEIGSGYSTMVMYQSVLDYSPKTKIISIDPNPRSHIDSISSKVYRHALSSVDLSIFKRLKKGDMVFFDGSHCLLPSSDVTIFFLGVLPLLSKGVIVQIHDIYLPYDYPHFMCQRLYSEQYALAIVLLNNLNSYKILMPNYFVSKKLQLSQVLKPLWDEINNTKLEKHGGSFWLEV